MRILIAEDDATSCVVLSGILSKAGNTVVETTNGDDAWRALAVPGAPEMVILDCLMPGLPGLEVLRRLRAVPTTQPVYAILLTSRGTKADIVEGLDAGANDYLVKPFDPAELLARVSVGRRMLDLQQSLAARIAELRLANEQIKTLRGVVPICANCKKIRDDQGYWNQVEVYVRDHTEATFTHGICPDCVRKLYPEVAFDLPEAKER